MHKGPKEGLSLHLSTQVVLAGILSVLSLCMTENIPLPLLFHAVTPFSTYRKQSGICHLLEMWGPLDLIPIDVLSHKVFLTGYLASSLSPQSQSLSSLESLSVHRFAKL